LAFSIALALLSLISSPVFAKSYAAVTTTVTPTSAQPGGKAALIVHIKLAEGYHINANKPNDEFLIPTTLTFKTVAGATFGAVAFPKAAQVKESYSEKPMLVYKGDAIIKVPVLIAKTAKKGQLVLSGELKYQACSHQSCYPPVTQTVSAVIIVK
jgi:hypothetical protein